MKKHVVLFALVVLSLYWIGCKDSELQQFSALGAKHKVTLYGCDGKVIHQWIATGSVSNESNSDGWYFKDEATGKLVEVTGTIVIEQE